VKALWQRYTTWFDQRAQRERVILAVAILGSVLLLGVDYWAGPALKEARTLAAQAQQNSRTAADMEAQAAQLQVQLKDPDAALRAELEQVKRRLADQEPRFRDVARSLVSAAEMPAFLESLLARNQGVQMVSLRTLPPKPVIEREPPKTAAAAAPPGAEANIYKHGMQIRLSGSFRELVGYLADLEKAPQQVIWGAMDLSVAEYPRAVLSLTVYTISLDKAWLTL